MITKIRLGTIAKLFGFAAIVAGVGAYIKKVPHHYISPYDQMISADYYYSPNSLVSSIPDESYLAQVRKYQADTPCIAPSCTSATQDSAKAMYGVIADLVNEQIYKDDRYIKASAAIFNEKNQFNRDALNKELEKIKADLEKKWREFYLKEYAEFATAMEKSRGKVNAEDIFYGNLTGNNYSQTEKRFNINVDLNQISHSQRYSYGETKDPIRLEMPDDKTAENLYNLLEQKREADSSWITKGPWGLALKTLGAFNDKVSCSAFGLNGITSDRSNFLIKVKSQGPYGDKYEQIGHRGIGIGPFPLFGPRTSPISAALMSFRITSLELLGCDGKIIGKIENNKLVTQPAMPVVVGTTNPAPQAHPATP